ncbi:40S ribosomal protein S5-1 [Hordeum vulgare]|nr:40S ribosomal protein S5-1 [Hordeum vulgare]
MSSPLPADAAAAGGVSAPELMRHQERDMYVRRVVTDSEGGGTDWAHGRVGVTRECRVDKFFERIINPNLAEVLQHPQTIEMHEVVLHIRDVEGPKNTESVEARLETMEQQVFMCQGIMEQGLNANNLMIADFTHKHKLDAKNL